MNTKNRYPFERIELLRKDKGITQNEIAQVLGISQRNYSHYERGETNIPLDILCGIAIFHDTSIDYILNLTDEKKPYKRKNR